MLYFLALFGGFLIFASQPPRKIAPLQILGLALFIGSISLAPSFLIASVCGLLFAGAQLVPTLLGLRLPWIVSAILSFSQAVLWILVATVGHHFLREISGLTPLILACLGAFFVWFEWTVLPLWGTTQAFSRPWSLWPKWVRFVSFGGTCSVSFALFFVATSLVLGFSDALFWLQTLFFVAVVTIINWVLEREKAVTSIKVAVFGWGEPPFSSQREILETMRDQTGQAARKGAQLLVFPEAVLSVENRETFRKGVASWAAQHKIGVAVGYFDCAQNRNCIDFFSARGKLEGRYVKTHLVPVFEKYTRGNGELSLMDWNGVRVGGLICQDDNFSDIAHRYARSGTQLLAIPTNDWLAVKDFHFVGALWRALECRYAMAIAASGGISAIVDGRGRILAQCDHFREGAQLLVASVEILRAHPKAVIFQNWFLIVCGLSVFFAYLS